VGAIQLSETLPSLSPYAVEFLLRGSRDYNAMVAFNKEAGLLTEVWLPSDQTIGILEELEAKKLVTVQVGLNGKNDNAATLRQAVAEFKKKYPGRDASTGNEDQVHLVLLKPANVAEPPYSWRMTELGRNAVNIILKAVSSQLVPRPREPDRAAK